MSLNSSYKKWHAPNKSGTKAEGGTSRTHQGYYNIINKEKYIGEVSLCIYRSSWEFAFMKWCDSCASVIRWSSEPIKVPYADRVSKLDECKRFGLDPNNPKNWVTRNYNVDFWIEINKGGERPEKWFIEVKPQNKLKKPDPIPKTASLKEQRKFNTQAKEYLINEAKFAALDSWAKKNGAKFYVFTETVMTRLGILGGRFDYQNNKKK